MIDLSFLKAPRFWAMVIASVAFYLKQKGIFGEPEMILIATITAGFTVVKTIDRTSDKAVESAKIVSGIPPEEAKPTPPLN